MLEGTGNYLPGLLSGDKFQGGRQLNLTTIFANKSFAYLLEFNSGQENNSNSLAFIQPGSRSKSLFHFICRLFHLWLLTPKFSNHFPMVAEPLLAYNRWVPLLLKKVNFKLIVNRTKQEILCRYFPT